MSKALIPIIILTIGFTSLAKAAVLHSLSIIPGTAIENQYLLKQGGTQTVSPGVRSAEPGAYEVYRFFPPAGSSVRIKINFTGSVNAAIYTDTGRRILAPVQSAASGIELSFKVPPHFPLGTGIRLLIRATAQPSQVSLVRITTIEPDHFGNGLGDRINGLMGAAPGRVPQPVPSSKGSTIAMATSSPFSPKIVYPADTILLTSNDPDTIGSWKDGGNGVICAGGLFADSAYARQHPDQLQINRSGQPISLNGGLIPLVPMPTTNQAASDFFQSGLSAGAGGICFQDPEYAAQAGYSAGFKSAYQSTYNQLWSDPTQSVDARMAVAQLMADLERDAAAELLDGVQKASPNSMRWVELHSPLTTAQQGTVSPTSAISSISSVQTVLGQVGANAAGRPVPYADVPVPHLFSLAYLNDSYFNELTRSTGKKLWLEALPPQTSSFGNGANWRNAYTDLVAAALMFPDVSGYELLAHPTETLSQMSPHQMTVVMSVRSLLSLAAQLPRRDFKLDAGTSGIGLFSSDTMDWEREPPSVSDLDGFFGLSLPAIEHGIPITVPSLERAGDPGYLQKYKVLVLPADLMKATSAAINNALANWIKAGGVLLIFGGYDPYNQQKTAWWSAAGFPSPPDELLHQLGLNLQPAIVSRTTPQPDSAFSLLGSASNPSNPSVYNTVTYNLTPFIASGSVIIRIENESSTAGAPVSVRTVELSLNGSPQIAFATGTALESHFSSRDSKTQLSDGARTADEGGEWEYRFDVPTGSQAAITLNIAGDYRVLARAALPADRRSLAAAADTPLTQQDPSVALKPQFSALTYQPSNEVTPLYMLKETGGADLPGMAGFMARIGHGAILYEGVSSGLIASSAEAAQWYRDHLQYALDITGLSARESNAMVVQRGPITVVKTFTRNYPLRGSYLDVFSPQLSIMNDPVVPSHSCGVYFGPLRSPAIPQPLWCADRLEAQTLTGRYTALLVTGTAGSLGRIRMWTAGRSLAAVKGLDEMGNAVPTSVKPDADTLLISYTNQAGGTIIRMAWRR